MTRVSNVLLTYQQMVHGKELHNIEQELSEEKVLGIIHLFDNIKDVRVPGMVLYPLDEILVIAFLAVLSGADTWVEIAQFAKGKMEWLGGFLQLKNGVPSHDTFQRVFGLIEKSELQEITVKYLESIMDTVKTEIGKIQQERVDKNASEETAEEETTEKRHLSMDGKEERGTGRKPQTEEEVQNTQTFHVYDCSTGICLKSEVIERKTNEIPVGQQLLGVMDLRNSIVTADALHTQKNTCSIIIQRKGQYVLGLKGNQKNLLEETRLCFTERAKKAAEKTKGGKNPRYYETKEKAHNQLEKRRYYMVKAYHEPADKNDTWAGLKTFIMLEKEVENLVTNEKKLEVRYYISSLTDIHLCAQMIREHWGVENKLHWHLDYTFHMDENTTTDRIAFTNLGLMKKMALTLLKLFQPLMKGRVSLRVLRKRAGWETEKIVTMLFASLSRDNIRAALMNNST